MVFDAYQQGLQIVREALDNSEIMADFFGDGRHYEVRRVLADDTSSCAEVSEEAMFAPPPPTQRR